LIDVAAGRVDITITAPSTASQFKERATVFPLSSSKDAFLRQATIGAYVIAKKDTPKERVDFLLRELSKNLRAPHIVEWERANKVDVVFETGDMAARKAANLRSKYKAILERQPLD
jgi:hypothetical protein